MTRTARVVVIGGGAVGCSALYHLALRGWTDCLLLEMNELTPARPGTPPATARPSRAAGR